MVFRFTAVSFRHSIPSVLRPRTLLLPGVILAFCFHHGCSREAEVTVTQLDDPGQETPTAAEEAQLLTLRLPPSDDGSGHWTSLPLSRKKKEERRFAYFLKIEHRSPTFEYFARNSQQEIMEAMDAHLRDRYTYSDLFDAKGVVRTEEQLEQKLSTDLAAELFSAFRKVSPQDPLLVFVRMAAVQSGAFDQSERKRRKPEKTVDQDRDQDRKRDESEEEKQRVAALPGQPPQKGTSLSELEEKLQPPTIASSAGGPKASVPPPVAAAADQTPAVEPTRPDSVFGNPYR